MSTMNGRKKVKVVEPLARPPSPPPIQPPQALQNQDILHLIFEYLGLQPGSQTTSQTRKNLLAAGKTCKAFLEPALNSLWRVLPSLLPLLLLLPSAEIVNNEYFVDNLSLNSWERFEIHAARVRTLYMERLRVVISPHVYLRIRSMRHRDTPLLPSLKEIYIPKSRYNTPLDLSSALLLVSESSFNLIQLGGSATSDRQFFVPFLSLLSVNSPYLAHLSLCGTTDASTCLGLVPRFRSLQSLELRLSGIHLDCQIIQELGTLDNLLEMILEIPPITPTTNPNPKPPAAPTKNSTFIKLRRFGIIGSSSSITRVLDYMNILTNLTTLIITTDNSGVDTESSWKRCFAIISTFSAIEDIEITCRYGPPDYALPTSYFHPLRKLNNLTNFVIKNFTLSGSDDDFRLLARSFPKLKKFVEICSDPSEQRTLACLLHFSQENPDLREMEIFISSGISTNLKAINVSGHSIIQNHQHPLERLHIASEFCSLDLSAMIQLAQFLDLVFPNLSILTGTSEDSIWIEVQKIREALRAARINASSASKI